MFNDPAMDENQSELPSKERKQKHASLCTVNRLTDCVKVECFDETELKKVVKVCGSMKLHKLYTTSLNALLGNEAGSVEEAFESATYSRRNLNQSERANSTKLPTKRCLHGCGRRNQPIDWQFRMRK